MFPSRQLISTLSCTYRLVSRQYSVVYNTRERFLSCGCGRYFYGLRATNRRHYSSEQESPKAPDSSYQGSFISWPSVFAVLGVGGVSVFVLNEFRKQKDQTLAAKRQVMIGKPDLGGDWTLIDHHGERRTNKDFLGQWVILYFGFSFCPDICPEQMEKLVEAVDRIDDDRLLPNVKPIFITLDPERDTPLHLAKYVSEFSPKVLGMTGTPEQVKHAAKAYRIYYSAGPKDEDNDYIVDHSIIMYLVNPEGTFSEYFGQNKTASEIYTGCKQHMLQWSKETFNRTL